MTSFEQMKAFATAVATGSLSLAARELGVSGASVTRSINALERHLGVKLLHRTPRLIRLTDIGERFLGDCKRILDEVEEAEAHARNAHSEPQGELTLTAPVLFGQLHILPLLLDFLDAHPKVQVRALFVDRVVQLIEENTDVALRIASLPDSRLHAVKVGAVRIITVASPEYLDKHGTPKNLTDLPKHYGVGLAQIGGAAKHWTFPEPGSAAIDPAIQPKIALTVNMGEPAIDAALAGHGLVRALSYQVYEHIRAGRLRRILTEQEPPPIPVQLVYPAGLKATAKVRAFVDFAAAGLREHPALQEEKG